MRRLFVVLALALSVRVAIGLAPVPEALDREAAIAKLMAATAADAPNATTLTVAQSRYVKYEPDGSEIAWVEFWTKALTERGAVELRDIPAWFKEGFSEAEFQVVEVVRADGTVEPIDVAANTRVATTNSGNDANIYDETMKRLVLTVPRLEKGDSLHVMLAQYTHRPRIPNTYSDLSIFESSEEPVQYAEFTVSAPAELPLRGMALLGEVPGTVTATHEVQPDGRTLHRWVARDVPQTFAEENMPEESTQLQRVVVSTFPSWYELSKWYWGLCEGHLAVTPAIREKVRELTEGKDDLEKIEALFGFVAQSIRYMGIIAEDTAPGYEPHDVALTFDNRYGVCRDKGALLVAMLREAGFQAFPVLINAGSHRDKEVAIPYFNHAIVAVEMEPENYYLLDPTDDTARAELPAYLSDCTYLVARPEGDDLRVTPVPSPEENRMAIVTEATLDASGTLMVAATLDFGGLNDTAYRPLFVKNPPRVVRDRFEAFLKRVLPGAEIADFTFSPENPKDISQPLQVKLSARVPDYAVADSAGHVVVTLPFLSRTVGLVNFLFDGLTQPTRKYDWVITAPSEVHEDLTLHGFGQLGTAALLPEDPILKCNGASYDVVCRRDDTKDEIYLTREVALTQKTYSPEGYRALRHFVERMTRNDGVRPLFSKAPGQDADGVVVKRMDFSTLATDGVRTRRQINDVRVLTFQGKRANGEVKLFHNPAFQELTLNAAEVRTAKGDLVCVTEKEINRLDADGAALSPRYPSAIQTVISLPAVDIGAVTHVDWQKVSRDERPFCETITFASPYPVEEWTYSLAVPTAQVETLHVAEYNFANVAVERSVKTAGHNTIYTWTLRDLPALRPEPGMPSSAFFRPTIYVTSQGAAADEALPAVIAKANALLAEGCPAAEAAAEALVKDWPAEAPLEDKLRAVQTFLARRIRDLGPSWSELPFGTLTPPDVVLADGYANRLDKLLLQQAMLRTIGVESELVFASALSMAECHAFRHLLADDKRSPWTRWTRPYLRLADGRLLGDEGEFNEPGTAGISSRALMTAGGMVPYERPAELRGRTDNTLRLVVKENGDAVLTTDSLAWGLPAGALRQAEKETTPEQRRRRIAAIAEGLAPGAKPFSEYVVDVKHYPVRSRLTVEAAGYATRQGDLLSIPLPPFTGVYGLRGGTRENPIAQNENEGTERVVDVWLPPGAEVVSKPEPFTYALPGGGTVAMTCTMETRPVTGMLRMTYRITTAASPAMLDSWLYPALLDLDRRLRMPVMNTLIIRLGGAN